MAYNNNVSILDIGKDSTINRAIVEKLTASGTTNFAVVFENINKLLSKSGKWNVLCVWFLLCQDQLDGVMATVLIIMYSSEEDRGFDAWSGQCKD